MKLIYFTDIHDARKQLRTVFEQTHPDLYLVSGDLIYKAFLTEDKLFHFVSVQEDLYAYIRLHGLRIAPYDLSNEILRQPHNHPEELQTTAADYRLLYQKASYNMKAKYTIFRELFSRYSKVPVMSIPGNYDMDLQYTAMQDVDLHLQSREYFGLKFSGYGGAPIVTPGIPDMLSVVFHEYSDDLGRKVNEPYQFLSKEKPDVAVIHNPPYGRLDTIAGFGCVGSQGIRNYVDENRPCLVLSGHLHEDCGLLFRENTFFLNCSNFGEVENAYGLEEKGGYFCEIEFLPNSKKQEQAAPKPQPQKITLCRLVEGKIIKVAQVDMDENGKPQETIFSKENVFSFGGFLR